MRRAKASTEQNEDQVRNQTIWRDETNSCNGTGVILHRLGGAARLRLRIQYDRAGRAAAGGTLRWLGVSGARASTQRTEQHRISLEHRAWQQSDDDLDAEPAGGYPARRKSNK
jgi:hypothetical protein